MELKLIKIGNSKGVRLPKVILEELGNFSVADLKVKNGSLVITPKYATRQDWESKFKDFGQDKEEPELLMDFNNDADEKEWTW
ncbi:MAG: hypothetical protein OEY59_08210 [Deltaproteobacteria bacterium]|nr:hypothetical protein [Deltaproteobacteria bacterium]